MNNGKRWSAAEEQLPQMCLEYLSKNWSFPGGRAISQKTDKNFGH